MTKNCTVRKILFVLSGIGLATVLALLGKTYYAEAKVKEGQKFDDWGVACAKENDKNVCFLSQVLTSKEDTKQRIAEFRIGYFDGKTLKMIQILPFGVNLQSGTSIISDTKLIAPGKFTTCQQFGCIAVVDDFTQEAIDQILSAEKNSVGIISAEGKQINVELSNKGLKEGLEALKK